MQVHLNGQTGDLTLPEGSSFLGRGHDCVLRVNDPRLSRHHAQLHLRDRVVQIEDCGSTNGVLVNGNRITGLTVLSHDDVIVCGPCLFTIAIDTTLMASNQPPAPPIPAAEGKLHTSTESMDPVVISATAEAALRNRTPAARAAGDKDMSSRLDPRIAQALTTSGETAGPSFDPDDESNPPTSALDARRKGRGGPPTPLPIDPPTTPSPVHAVPKRDKTTGLLPNDFSTRESVALQPQADEAHQQLLASRGQRCAAGALDALQIGLIVLVLALPPLLSGYGWALVRAGATIERGLPVLPRYPASAADLPSLVGTLVHPGGVARAGDLIATLRDLWDPLESTCRHASLSIL